MMGRRHADIANGGASVGPPYGATEHVRSVPKYEGARESYGAAKRVRGAPKLKAAAARTVPRGPSLEPPMGPRHVRGVCRIDGAAAMRPLPLRRSVELPIGGHRAREGCAETRGMKMTTW